MIGLDLLLAFAVAALAMVLLALIPSRDQTTFYFESLPPSDERLIAVAEENGWSEVTRIPPDGIRAIESDDSVPIPWSELGYLGGGTRYQFSTPRADFLLRGLAGLQIGLFAVAVRRWKTGAVPTPVIRFNGRNVGWGLAFGLAIALLSSAMTGLFFTEPPDSPLSALPSPASGPGALLFMVVLLVGPVSEEMFFRGVVLQRFFGSELRLVAGVIVSSWLFAALHGVSILLLPIYFVAGVLLAVAFLKGGLAASIVAHVTVNALAVLWLFRAGRVGAGF